MLGKIARVGTDCKKAGKIRTLAQAPKLNKAVAFEPGKFSRQHLITALGARAKSWWQNEEINHIRWLLRAWHKTCPNGSE